MKIEILKEESIIQITTKCGQKFVIDECNWINDGNAFKIVSMTDDFIPMIMPITQEQIAIIPVIRNKVP